MAGGSGGRNFNNNLLFYRTDDELWYDPISEYVEILRWIDMHCGLKAIDDRLCTSSTNNNIEECCAHGKRNAKSYMPLRYLEQCNILGSLRKQKDVGNEMENVIVFL